MKFILCLSLLITSSFSFSSEVTKELEPEEIELVISVADKYEVPLQGRSVCLKTEFDVISRVKGFNPASWTLAFNDKEVRLSSDEIQGFIAIFNRVAVPLSILSSISTESRATITGASCGYNPNRWTISFIKRD